MKKENQGKLIATFPELFTTDSGVIIGMQCFDGWFDIIFELTDKLNTYAKEHELRIKVIAIKEKLGGLRYDCDIIGTGATSQRVLNEINELIENYRELSYKTCEVCGHSGNITNIGRWLATVCDKHKESERK